LVHEAAQQGKFPIQTREPSESVDLLGSFFDANTNESGFPDVLKAFFLGSTNVAIYPCSPFRSRPVSYGHLTLVGIDLVSVGESAAREQFIIQVRGQLLSPGLYNRSNCDK